MRTPRIATAALFAAFVATVYGANLALTWWGELPVGLGLKAPAGVLFAGLAFGLRDALHERGGVRAVLAAIAVGGALSYALGAGATIPGGHVSIALASAVAFTLAELGDLLVYRKLRQRTWVGAVAASNALATVIDSALFLWLAFGSLDLIAGQVVGKTYLTLAALPIVWAARRRQPRVYLCGPINGCTDDEATTWREQVKTALGADACIDPMRRDYRGREDECVDEIVAGDLADIEAATVILANCWAPSFGTAMELWHARRKPVVVIAPPGKPVSPWLRHVADDVVHNLDDAIAAAVRLG